MPLPPFTILAEEMNKEATERIEKNFEDFAAYIKNQKTIRCLVQDAPGYGHQSASVNLVRRLATPPDQMPGGLGVGYAGTIEIYGDMDKTDSAGKTLRLKLQQLFPEFGISTKGGIIGKAVIKFLDQEKDKPADWVNFGFSGGYDFPYLLRGSEKSESLLAKLKIKTFLLLQPYNYRLDPYVEHDKKLAPELLPGNLLFYGNGSPPVYNYYNLDKTVDCEPFKVVTRAFYAPIRELTPEDWKANVDSVSDDEMKKFIWLLQLLTSAEYRKQFAICPLYGLNSPSPSVFRQPVSHCLALIINAYHQALAEGTAIKPPIIINFSPCNLVDSGDESYSFDYILDILNGGMTVDEKIARETLDEEGSKLSPDKKEYWERFVKNCSYRTSSFTGPAKDNYRLFPYSAINSMDKITPHLDWLKAPNSKRVLFIQANRVPPLIFNHILSTAGLPPIFEGNNTANIVINTGLPYFYVHSLGLIGTETLYPLGYVAGSSVYILVTELQRKVDHIQADFANWPAKLDEAPNRILALLLKTIYPNNQEIFDYFDSVKEFYQKPVNDKFVVAAALGKGLMGSAWEAKARLSRQ